MEKKAYKISWDDNDKEDSSKIEDAIITFLPMKNNGNSKPFGSLPFVDFAKIVPIPNSFKDMKIHSQRTLLSKARDLVRFLIVSDILKGMPESRKSFTEEDRKIVDGFLDTIKSEKLVAAFTKAVKEAEDLLFDAKEKHRQKDLITDWATRHVKKGYLLAARIKFQGSFDLEDWEYRNWEAQLPLTIGIGKGLVILTDSINDSPRIVGKIQEKLDSIKGLKRRATIEDITEEYFNTKDLPREQREPKGILWLDGGSLLKHDPKENDGDEME